MIGSTERAAWLAAIKASEALIESLAALDAVLRDVVKLDDDQMVELAGIRQRAQGLSVDISGEFGDSL